MNIVIIIVFLVMCGGILASLWQQDDKIEPFDQRILENETRIKSNNTEIDVYLKNLTRVVKENTDKINILVDRVNEIQNEIQNAIGLMSSRRVKNE